MAGFGGAVKLTGESEYRKALKQIQVNLKEVSSEMKLVSAQYDKNDKSTDALKARSEALAKTLTTQKSALSTLQAQYTKLSAEQSKNQAKHDALVAEYEEAQAELKRLEETVGTSSDEYKAQAQVVANLAKDVDKSSASNERNEQTLSSMRTEMNNLKSSIAGTESEINKADDATDELADSTKKAGNEARDAGEGFTVFKGVLANLASTAISSALNGLKSLGGALIDVGKQAITSYADYEQLVGGVETLFGESAGVVQDYASQAYKTAGLSANQYMETVTSFSASLINSLGGDTTKASEYANKAITDMSDNANKMGTDIEMIQNAYQGFAKGNFTMLDNLSLGFSGSKEGAEQLIKRAEQLDSTFKAQRDSSGKLTMSYADMVDAIHIVQTEMGITGTTAKEASSTISGSLASASSAWSNLLTGIADDNADFGKLIDEFVDSVLTVAKNLIPRIQTTITGLANMASGLLEELVPQLMEQIPPLIQQTLPILLNAVKSALQSILDVLPMVIDTISQLIPDVVSTIISLLPEVLSAGVSMVLSLIQGISKAIPELLGMLPSLITDIVSVVTDNLGLIVDTGIQLLDSLIDGILICLPELLDQMPIIADKLSTALIDNAPKLIKSGIELIFKLLEGVVKALPQLLTQAPKITAQMAQKIMAPENLSKLIDAGGDIIGALVDGAKSLFGKLGDLGGDVIFKLVNALKSLPDKMLNIGKNIVEGMINGVKSMASKAVNAVKNLGTSLINGVKKSLGIASPSKVFKQLGEYTAEGYIEGYTDEMKNATSELQDAIPTIDTNASVTASGLPTGSLSATGGVATTALVEAFKTAMEGMIIEMGEDGFAQFVVKTITNEIYQ